MKIKAMTLKEAIETMKAHNEWRRGAETGRVNPKYLGVAIDVLVSHAEQSQPSGGKSAEDVLRKYIMQDPDMVGEQGMYEDWEKQKSYSLVISAMEEYASQYAHQQPVQGQLCPKCNGEGKCFEILIPTEYRVCPVCNGDKILYPPISQQPVNDGWVMVEDKSPEKEGLYLAWVTKHTFLGPPQGVHVAYFGFGNDEDFTEMEWSIRMTQIEVTHWRPLPEPPKQ